MKSQFVTTLVSFLLLALATKPLLAWPNPLLDVDGNEVKDTYDYYVVPAIPESRTLGLTLFPSRKGKCPFDVVQESSGRGIRIRFATYKNTSIIHEGTDLNVMFSMLISNRMEQLVWKVDDYDDSRGKWFITTGGVEGHPGAQTLQNWFKFEKSEKFSGKYKIVYCPSVCHSCVSLCKNVGISHVDGAWRFVLIPDEERVLPVVLIQAKERVASI